MTSNILSSITSLGAGVKSGVQESRNGGSFLNGLSSGINWGRSGILLTDKDIDVITQYNRLAPEARKDTEILGETISGASRRVRAYIKNLEGGTAEMKKMGDETVLGAEGFDGFAQQIELTGKKMLVTMGVMLAVTLAMKGLQAAIQAATTYWENHSMSLEACTKRYEEAQDQFNDTASTLEDLNSEFETTQERIDELQGMGSLSFDEQAELEQLQEENNQLGIQIKLYEERNRLEAEALSKEAMNTLSATSQTAGSPNYQVETTPTLLGDAQAQLKNLEKTEKKIANISDTNSKKYKRLVGERDEYESDLLDQVETIQGYLNNADYDSLSAADQRTYDQYLDFLREALPLVANITVSDALNFDLSTDEVEDFFTAAQEYANDLDNTFDLTKEEAEDIFGPEVIASLEAWGFIVDDDMTALNNHLLSLRDTGTVVNALLEDEFSELSDALNDIINDTSFELDTDSITKALGQDFVDALAKAGVSVKDLISWIERMQDELDSITVSDATSELKGVEEFFSALDDAYSDFVDNGAATAKTLDGLYTSLADLEDVSSLDNLVQVLGNTASTAEDVTEAINQVAESYLNQATSLGNLTDETKDLYVAQLEQMGVANATEVVEYKLAWATLQDADASDEAKEAAWELVDSVWAAYAALDAETIAALDAEDKLELYQAAQELAAGNNFTDVVLNHAAALLRVAEAAGKSAESLAKYAEVVARIATLQSEVSKGSAQSSEYDRRDGVLVNSRTEEVSNIYAEIAELQKLADELEEAAKVDFENILGEGLNIGVTVDYTPSYTGSSKSSSSSSSSTTAKTVKDLYDEEKKYLDWLLEMNKITYEEYYNDLWGLAKKYLKGQSDYIEDYRQALADVSQARRDAYDESISELDKSLAKGKITIQEYYDESMKLAKKWLDNRTSTEQDYADAVEAIYDQVIDYWEDRISSMQTRMDRWSLTLTWNPNKTETEYWEEMLDELRDDYLSGLFADTKEYYNLRYELLEKLQAAQKSAWEEELDYIQDASDSIQDLIDLVSDMMKQELNDEIDALEDQLDLYTDIVNAKKESLSLTKSENEYQKEIEQYNKDLADLQAQAAVLAMDDSREGQAKYAAVLEEIREKQEEIAEAQADHTYDATVDALEAAQAAYQEKIEERVSDIQALMEEAGPWLERVYQRIEETPPSTLLEQLKNYNYYHGTGMDSDVEKIWSASEGLLEAFNSNIPQILAYLANQEALLEEQINSVTSSSSGENASANYDTSLKSKVQASVTQGNTDEQNMDLMNQVEAQYGAAWYDPDYKVIYMGEDGDRRVTAGAYELIQTMQAIAEDSSLSRADKEAQLDEQLEKLQRKWSYGDAHIVWTGNTPHLYKTAGTSEKWKIFHSGLEEGFVGSDGNVYYPISKKQNETYALLTNDELVLNRSDQEKLGVQLQVLSSVTDALKKMQFDGLNRDNICASVGDITIDINAPISINGATEDVTEQLNNFTDQLADRTLVSVTSALKKRGYNTSAAYNARKAQ